jgi:hypothetical protein
LAALPTSDCTLPSHAALLLSAVLTRPDNQVSYRLLVPRTSEDPSK